MQNTISRKIYLELLPPTEEDARGDRERILEQLAPEYGEVSMPLSVLRTLYPMCRDAGYQAVASQIEIFAKLSLLAVSLPVVTALINTIESSI